MGERRRVPFYKRDGQSIWLDLAWTACSFCIHGCTLPPVVFPSCERTQAHHSQSVVFASFTTFSDIVGTRREEKKSKYVQLVVATNGHQRGLLGTGTFPFSPTLLRQGVTDFACVKGTAAEVSLSKNKHPKNYANIFQDFLPVVDAFLRFLST